MSAYDWFVHFARESIPYLFAFYVIGILIEVGWSYRRGLRLYLWQDFALTIGLVAIYQLINAAVARAGGLISLQSSEPLPKSWQLFELPRSVWVIVVAFVALDFVHYLGHVALHRVRWLWALHTPHHSSQKFHLLLHFRGTPLQNLSFLPYYALLLFIGFPPDVLVGAGALSFFYQFFSHLATRPGWGALGYVFVTPRTHLVHHACNPEYINKNYGSVFTVWDRLFGTHVELTVPAEVGTERGFVGYNPFTVAFHPIRDLFKQRLDYRG